eukprot:CAMPEP_0171179358 /NCGR_PEP_ID=MMETSP0790-20130122/13216_1 /TAXON_ID=2925 /ORGANISM="Alexandrium catenella, Strain OF101" /LENGTH=105 /DNA_ID=CAMNT_0011644289 /DNA_START=114 /DNA_END=428 /DNA_ORIENTATION=+
MRARFSSTETSSLGSSSSDRFRGAAAAFPGAWAHWPPPSACPSGRPERSPPGLAATAPPSACPGKGGCPGRASCPGKGGNCPGMGGCPGKGACPGTAGCGGGASR